MSQPATNDKSVQILLTNLEKKSQEYLEIKPSNITGQGLFTKAVLRADVYVCPMFYQVSSTGDPDRDYKKAEYGKYVNHNITPNCDLKQEGNCYVLHTRQQVEVGEELTIDYRDLPWDDAQVEDDDNSDKIMLTGDELRQLSVIKSNGKCKTIYYPITQDEFDNGYVEVMASDSKDGKQLFTTRVGMERWIADESMSDRYPYYLMIMWCTNGIRIKGPGFYFISDTIPELDRVYQSFYYKGSYKFLFDQAYRIFTQDAFKTQPDVSVTEALHQRKVVMDLFTMDEVDETSMAEAAMEMLATRIKKVKEIIQKTKKVSISDYVSTMKPGDLMVTYPLTKRLDAGSLLFSNLNTFFQGSSFTSIKMVSEDGKHVMGYSAKLNSHGELNEEKIETFASVSGGMCLIRPKKITETQRQKAVKWMRKKLKEKLGYSQKAIVKSLLAHLLHITKGAVNLDRKEIQKYSDPLICSSIVGFAYEYAGIKLQMPYSTFNIWPIDFLKSDQFEKVCCYFADGEYPEIIDEEKKEEDEEAKVQFGFGVDIDKTVGDLVTGQDSKDGLKVGSAEAATAWAKKSFTEKWKHGDAVHNNTLYRGMDVDVDTLTPHADIYEQEPDPSVNLTPSPAIAIAFGTPYPVLTEHKYTHVACHIGTRINMDNFYDKLTEVEYHVNIPGYDRTFISEIYLYEIDYAKYKDKCYGTAYGGNNVEECCVKDDVQFKKKTKLKIKCIVKGTPEMVKKYGAAKKVEGAAEAEEPKIVPSSMSDVNSVSDLRNFYKKCAYGLPSDKRFVSAIDKDGNRPIEWYIENWKLLSPEAVLKSGVGICYDTVNLSIAVMKKLRIEYKVFFAHHKGDDGLSKTTHTFLIFKDTSGWRWLEGSWGTYIQATAFFASAEKAVDAVSSAMAFDCRADIVVHKLTSYPAAGSNMDKFTAECMKGAVVKTASVPKDGFKLDDYASGFKSYDDAGIKIVKADLDNADDLKDLVTGLNLAADTSGDTRWSASGVKENAAAHKDKRFYFLTQNNARIGTFTLVHGTDGLLIGGFAIYSEYQGKGLGTRGMLAIIEYARKGDDSKVLVLGVAKSNSKALSLYKKIGFVICENESKTYRMKLDDKPKVALEAEGLKSVDHLYIYIPRPNTVVKDGIFAPSAASREQLRHYTARTKEELGVEDPSKEDILKYLETWFPGRSRAISVLTEPIPDSATAKQLEFRDKSDCFVLPSYAELKRLGIAEACYLSVDGKGNKDKKVSNPDYSSIDWESISEKQAYTFKGVRHYFIVLKHGVVPAKYCDKLMEQPSDEELLQYSNLATTVPAVEAESMSAKKQQIVDYVTKYFKKFDKTPVDNAKRFADMVNKMTDKEFHEYMTALRDKKTKLAFYAPNMVSHTSIDDLLAVCKELGIKVQTKLKLQDPTTGKWFWTPDEYVVLQLPVRRAQQFVDKKIGVPDNDLKIDALTGQVTQEDRSTSFTNPEIQMTFSRGLTAVLAEFLQIRGGNPNAYAEFRRQLEETGSCSMNSIDPNFESRTARMAGVLLRSMHLDNNIVEGE